MLIRSQDKKKLMNLDGLTHLQIDKTGEVYKISAEYCIEDGYQYIGVYSTESKAIKVLDMIQQSYELSLYSDHAFDSSAQVMRPYIFVNNRAFQMPSDEEMEE